MARLTGSRSMPVRVEFDSIKGYHCFIQQETVPIAQYWLVPGTNSCVISESSLNVYKYKLTVRDLWEIGVYNKTAH